MSLRHNFDKEIDALNKDILKMGLLVEESVKGGIESFKDQDCEKAEKVIQNDQYVNEMEDKLCDQCVILLAKEQPVASDLRHILSAIKIITQLERIADHGVHVAKKTISLADQKYMEPITILPKMETIAREMLNDSLSAYVERDSDWAEKIAKRDSEIDDLYKEVMRRIVKQIDKDSTQTEQGIELLFAARYLERFGDHVKNICEWVIFSEKGEHRDF